MLENKHIVFVQHAGIGGAFISLKQIVEAALNRGMKVTVLLLRNDIIIKNEFEKIGVFVKILPKLSQVRFVVGGWINIFNPLHVFFAIRDFIRLPLSFNEFRKNIIQLKPDIVYLNSLCVFPYVKIARKEGIPVILHIREMYKHLPLLGKVDNWHKKNIEKYANIVFAIGHEEFERLGLHGNNCHVVRNYVDIEKWSYVEKREVNNVPVILYVGGLNIIKGFHILIQALSKLKEKGINFRCIFLGVGIKKNKNNIISKLIMRLNSREYYNFYKTIDKLGLNKLIEFVPFVTNPIEIFKNSDVLVFPSIEPHFARPVIEAGAVGLPVIASDISGPRDTIENGKNGLLVKPNNVEELACTIETMLSNPEMARKMGKMGRIKVEKEYNNKKNSATIMASIDSVLSNS